MQNTDAKVTGQLQMKKYGQNRKTVKSSLGPLAYKSSNSTKKGGHVGGRGNQNTGHQATNK